MTRTPDEIGARLAAALGGEPVTHSISGGGTWARATVDVPPQSWRAAMAAARDDADLALDFFDWLSAVDELDGGFTLVVHLWSSTLRHGALIRTRLADRAAPVAASIVDLFPGAAWHERETREMFGVEFSGDPATGSGDPASGKPLLLPPEFEGHPLRKDFVLATRVAKPWPGAKEPGESGHGPAKRQPMRPPGVPDPREWGPAAVAGGAAVVPGGAADGADPTGAGDATGAAASRAARPPRAARPVPDRAATDRPARPDRPERPARPDRPERPARPEPPPQEDA
jgi:NADH-quinone oxidoreductase subunit C